MTQHHLAIAMEYAPGGDLSEYVDACKRAGVRHRQLWRHHAFVSPMLHWASCSLLAAMCVCNVTSCCVAWSSLEACRRQMRGGSSSSSSLRWTTATGLGLPTATSRCCFQNLRSHTRCKRHEAFQAWQIALGNIISGPQLKCDFLRNMLTIQ